MDFLHDNPTVRSNIFANDRIAGKKSRRHARLAIMEERTAMLSQDVSRGDGS